jgi:hypothetical protein
LTQAVLHEPVESRALVAALGAADAMVDVLFNHLRATTFRNLAEREELRFRILMAVTG